MALDENGGPSVIENYIDSAIIINATADEFYKQPMYYAIAHVSKYVPPDSIRVDSSVNLLASVAGVQAAAFLRPDNLTTVIIYNS